MFSETQTCCDPLAVGIRPHCRQTLSVKNLQARPQGQLGGADYESNRRSMQPWTAPSGVTLYVIKLTDDTLIPTRMVIAINGRLSMRR